MASGEEMGGSTGERFGWREEGWGAGEGEREERRGRKGLGGMEGECVCVTE
jgi:hypothetical protein